MNRTMRLEDFVTINPTAPLRRGEQYPCVMMEEVDPGRRYVYGNEYKEYSGGGARFQDGDTLFARITPSLENGKIAQFKGKYITEAFGSTEFIVFRAREGVSDSGFVYYLAKTDTVRKPAEKSMFGASGRQRADVNVVKQIMVPSPPLPTQRKIAAVLSAYDDLIENNTRRIHILEEMAQTLYRHWFVDYQFPGYEGVPLVDSGTKLGLVPEGWEIKKISDVASMHRGKSYRSQELLEEGGLPFLNLKCVDREGGFRQDGIKRFQGEFKEAQTALPGDIIIALTDMTQERRIIARAARVPDTGENYYVMSMDLVKVIAYPGLSQSYLYSLLRFSTFPDEVKEFANGVNVLHLNPSYIEDYKFFLPPINLTEEFGAIADGIYQLIDILHKRNLNLRITRDLLLPKLVSGELDVSELEIEVPAA